MGFGCPTLGTNVFGFAVFDPTKIFAIYINQFTKCVVLTCICDCLSKNPAFAQAFILKKNDIE